jgi:hypothetical protein
VQYDKISRERKIEAVSDSFILGLLLQIVPRLGMGSAGELIRTHLMTLPPQRYESELIPIVLRPSRPKPPSPSDVVFIYSPKLVSYALQTSSTFAKWV